MDDEREVPSQLATVDTSIGSPGDVLTYLGPNFVPRFRPITGAGLGNVTGPATTTVDFVPQWNNTTGTLLKNGLPVSITGAASSLVETDAGGKIAASVIPVTGVTPGTYSSANITVLADGRLSAASPGAAAGIGDAPPGPTVYGRNTGAWLPVVPLTGATMTGQLLLPVPAGPTSAATKGYVDTAVSGLAPLVSPNFSGVPTAPNQLPADDSTRLATTHFVKSQGYGTAGSMSLTLTGDVTGSGTLVSPVATTIANTVGPATVSGITFNNRGLITAAADQGYITAASGAFVPSAGGTISGTAPGTLTINRSGAMPGPPATIVPGIWMVSGTGENASVVIDAFGTPTSYMQRRANGSAAAPARLSVGDGLGQLAWRGFHGPTTALPADPPGYTATVARIQVTALDDFDSVSQGTQLLVQTTPKGSAAITTQAIFGPGLTVGAAAAPTGGMLVGDANGVRLFQNGQPIVTSAALGTALAGYLPLSGGTLSGNLTISRNTTMPAAPAAAVLPLWMVAADTDLNPLFGMDAFNTQLGMMLRRANGIAASPTRIVNNDRLGNLAWRGYADTHYGLTSARITAVALEDYHDTAQGTQILFETTAVGTIGVTPQVQIGPGLTVGSPTPPAGGMQIGDGNFSRVLLNGVPITSVGGGGSGSITLTGDVTGSGTGTVASIVARMQGYPISTAAPLAGQVLGWNSTSAQWEPTAAVSGSGGPPGGAVGSVQINTSGAFGGIVMTGDASWNTTTTALTLNPSVMSTPGTFQGITVNGKGLVTAALPMNYATSAALAGYLPLTGGIISGSPGTLVINRNTAAAPPATGLTMLGLQVNFADDEVGGVILDSHAATNPVSPSIVLRQSRGPGTLPTPTQNGDFLGNIHWRGYDNTPGHTLATARILATTLEPFTTTGHGTKVDIATTNPGATALTVQATFDRGLTVGVPTATQPTPAAGDINAHRIFIDGVAVTAGAGGGTPGAPVNSVQYNNAGAFGGSTGALFSATSLTGMNIALGADGVGDMYFRAAGGALTRLGIGGSGNVLTVSGALLPSWSPLTAGSGTVSPGGSSPQIALYIGASTATVAPFTMSGDAQISATGALTINSGVVSYTKIQNVTNARLLGNNSGGFAAPSEIQLGANLTWVDATHFAATGSVSSVGMTVPGGSILGVTPATITSSGTFALTTTGNATGIPYFSSTSQLSSSGALTAHGVMIAGSPPVATSAGTLGYVFTSNGPTVDPSFQPSGSGAGTVNSAAVNLLAWYPGPTNPQAVVGGHPNISLGAAGSLAINRSSFAMPAPVNTSVLQINLNDNELGGILIDSHGAPAGASPTITLRNTRGVGGTLSQTILGDNLGNLGWRACDNTPAYTAPVVRLLASALESFTSIATGAKLDIATSLVGQTALTVVASFGPGLSVGPSPTAPTSPMVAGDLNVQGRIMINGNPLSFADTTATASAAGTTQATATVLTTQFTVITTVAAGTGVVLPAGSVGGHAIVRNSGANTLLVYPASGAAINTLAANAAIGVPFDSTAYFEASSTTQWFTVP